MHFDILRVSFLIKNQLILSISKLHIFSKNTDATASLKGYHYQVLKTLETLIDNYNEDKADEIYCDFEEDIFQKNKIDGTTKFRQIKLYSRNFSFSSEEIQKCLVHFFMLHVKTDYTFLEKEFVFETNTTVAGVRGNNDAELLQDWNKNQESLSDELTQKCAAKVKEIITPYIEKQFKSLIKDEDNQLVKEAYKVFNELQESDWIEFAKKIKWIFKDVASDKEFAGLRENIEEKILNLPFQINKDNLPSIFGQLHTLIWDKATSTEIESKKITLEDLTSVLLASSNNEDKWYWDAFERWKDVEKIQVFNLGQFYEAIDASRHCRVTRHLTKHKSQWLKILKIYISNSDDSYKRTAIYEYLWLLLRPLDKREIPDGDLKGEEEYFRFYFNDFEVFQTARELEDAQSLMNIAIAAGFMDKTNLAGKEVQGWFDQMLKTLKNRIDAEADPSKLCHFLENLAGYHLFINLGRNKEDKNVQEVIEPLNQILGLLEDAELYNVSKLSWRLDDFVELMIETGAEDNIEIIDALSDYGEKLNPFVEKRGGSFRSAKVELNKGVKYLNSDMPKLSLKALESFHKAKSKFKNEESYEGYVLALINIAQLYSGIGMNLASKYYAMCAAWVCIHKDDRKLLKRIADAFGIMFYADFKQGAWMNAIVSSKDYLSARHEFKGAPLDPEKEEMPFKVLADLALIFHLTPKMAPELKVMVNHEIDSLGEIGNDFIKPALQKFEETHPAYQTLVPALERQHTDIPLNDIGPTRFVRFNALGIEWEISFSNTYMLGPQAEEFCAIAQITIAEIALSKYDFHLIRGNVRIELEVSKDIKPPEQQPSNNIIIWTAWVRYMDSQEGKEVVQNIAGCVTAVREILSRLSLLPFDDYDALFNTLFKESDLADKTKIEGLYQRMYRYVFKQPDFDRLQRHCFNPLPAFYDIDLPKTNKVMEWDSSKSEKYDKEKSLANIDGRFVNMKKISHITISELIKDQEFIKLLHSLRKEGWQDWQIFLGITNFIVTDKLNRKLGGVEFASEEEKGKALQNIQNQIRKIDESEMMVKYPIEAFSSQMFRVQLNHNLILMLDSFGLANPSKFPNFQAVKEFLDIRFNVAKDGSGELNPFKDI